jgi:acetolactate synthase-1/2/3 large subunit
MVRQWQQMFFNKRYASTELINPDFEMIARGYGIPARTISARQGLKEGLQQMLEAEGPFILNIAVEKEGNVLPMVEPGASVSDVTLNYKG